MIKNNQKGEINLLLIPLVLIGLLLIAAIVFGVYTYKQEQKYKTKTDAIVVTHVQAATASQQQIDEKNFIEQAKQPLVTYKGPSDYGSLKISYPKTWSVYINQNQGNTPLDGYGYPGQVPGDTSGKTAYALRFQVVSQGYDQVVQNFKDQLQQQKNATVKPYHSKQNPSIIGVRIDGAIEQDKTGIMVILPLRDKTLQIWTEAPQFEHDFNKYILPNFSFQP